MQNCQTEKMWVDGTCTDLSWKQDTFGQSGVCALPCSRTKVVATMIYLGVNLTYLPESELPIFRGLGLGPIGGIVDPCAGEFPLVSMRASAVLKLNHAKHKLSCAEFYLLTFTLKLIDERSLQIQR